MPKNTALMLVDLQNRYCSPEHTRPFYAHIENAVKVCAAFSQAARPHMPIIHVGYAGTFEEVPHVPPVQRGSIAAPSSLAAFYQSVPQAHDLVFWKRDSHLVTGPTHPFLKYAKHKGLKTIFIAGVRTDFCVLATALSIKHHSDITPVVIADLCGSANAWAHDNGLRQIKMFGIQTTTNDKIRAQLGIK